MLNIKKPWENDSYLGNQKILEQLNTLSKNDKLNTTLLFHGSFGIGKATLAFRYTNYILCQESENFLKFKINNNQITNQIKNLTHPNLIYISNYDENDQSKEIKIEEIRGLKKKIMSKTINGAYRVVIIDSIDSLNKSSCNALLKILEEPPQKTIFILICHNINYIPDTILSRSIKFNFKDMNILNTNAILDLNRIKTNTDKIIKLYDNKRITAGKIVYLLKNNFEDIENDFEDFIANDKSNDFRNVLIKTRKYIKKEDNDKFLILIELFMIWIKKNAMKILYDIENNSDLLKTITYWDKYQIKYKNLNDFNLNKEEFILTLNKDVRSLLHMELL